MAHHHGHGGGCSGGDDHDLHDHDKPDLGIEYSLYSKIDLENLQCLNEETEGSGKLVFKPWNERFDADKYVESDADEELLFNIPFSGNVKLKGIIVMGGEGGSHPSKIRIFKNRPQMTFDDSQAAADQEFDLHPDSQGTLEYPVKVVKFSSVYHLSLHFPSNFGSETTKILYIGLRGEYTQARRQEIMLCSYELAPNPADHKTEAFQPLSRSVQ
ncbi:PITH domain-containing protein CG6153-like [Ornithodoros turicata]|uniref:Putative thioredoxin-like protein n=1 Tax=Ornithodoros turicata TaxID=34597 RepID=A0A2R5LI37_9ACAR